MTLFGSEAVAVGGVGSGLISPFAFLSQPANAPSLLVMAERRLGSHWYLMFNGGAGYSFSQSDTDGDVSSVSGFVNQGQSWRVDLAAGPRFLYNPGGLVELSSYALLSGGINGGSGAAAGSSILAGSNLVLVEDDSRMGYHVAGAMGFAVEPRLVHNISLRLSVEALEVGYGSATRTITLSDDSSETTTTQSFQVGATLRPTLGVRVRF
jgi:hypothetical protein